jgi:hypothetical protein
MSLETRKTRKTRMSLETRTDEDEGKHWMVLFLPTCCGANHLFFSLASFSVTLVSRRKRLELTIP